MQFQLLKGLFPGGSGFLNGWEAAQLDGFAGVGDIDLPTFSLFGYAAITARIVLRQRPGKQISLV